MFNSKFKRCLIALGVVFLFGVGYHFYYSHIESGEFKSGQFYFETTLSDNKGLDIEVPQNSLDKEDSVTNVSSELAERHWSTFDKQEWETYWSNQEPVKVKYAQTSTHDDEGVTTVPHEGPPRVYHKEDLVPQLVETPDGQGIKILWFSKLKPGQAVPHPKWWLGDKVIIDGLVYEVPPDETADSYIDKISLSTIYDVPLDTVDSLIEAGVIPSSPLDAQYDPIFDDPLFVTREDSRPVEASSGALPSDFGEPNEPQGIYLDEISANYPNLSDLFNQLVENPSDGSPNVDDFNQLINQLIKDPNGDHPKLDELISQLNKDSSGDYGETEWSPSGEIDRVGDSANGQPSLADGFEQKPAAIESKALPVTPDEIEAELNEAASPERSDKVPKGINQNSTEEKFRHLHETRRNPEEDQRFERKRLRFPESSTF